MLYMIIEDFKDGNATSVYRRMRESGRMTPEGVTYVESWVTTDLARCYQVMECDDRSLLDDWISRWSDLVNFEVVPVLSSEEASVSAS